MNEKIIDLLDKLALNDFMNGFGKEKSESSAKKSEEKPSKNVKHSISSGECNWKDENRRA